MLPGEEKDLGSVTLENHLQVKDCFGAPILDDPVSARVTSEEAFCLEGLCTVPFHRLLRF